MSATPRLYHDDSLLLAFDARVEAHASFQGKPSVVLDRTAFYPESGGQMADRGSLGGAPVVDVQVDDADVVHHVLGGPLPPVGAAVRGEIDAVRRRLHMALHTGQHMLSRALCDVADADTVSSRLGETGCTIDVDKAELDEARVAEAEALVNSVIDDDAAIRAFFPDAAELAALPLRRKPKVESHIRVVAIGDFDVSPCGGTHCLRTAQVGLVRVTGIERYKGKMRVGFGAGRRAREELARQSNVLQALGRDFTCGPTDVPAAIQKLRRELTEARESLGEARGRLAERAAVELVAAAREKGEARVVAVFEGADIAFLRAVAKRVTAEPTFVALLAARTPEGQMVLAARGAESDFDCGAFVKRVAAAHGGRGGGRPETAEGRLPPAADWIAAATMLSAQEPASGS
jgi:alanyl-tRNA synthetase